MDLSEDGVLSGEARAAALGASVLLPFLETELSRASFSDMCSRCAPAQASDRQTPCDLPGPGMVILKAPSCPCQV